MAIKLIEITARDGTSQADRPLGALDPGYVRVDERTTEDLVAFAREYGRGLTYYGLDDQPAGNWSAFIDPAQPSAPEARAAFLAKVAAFMAEPTRFNPSTSPELFRPHFVLFLTFIKLFQKSQAELNTLTHRHLEFYYGRFLGMLKKRPIPDRLNLIFDLRKGVNEAKVPTGTRLSAGADSLGRERIYTIDRELVVNRARIAALRSVFVERSITGVKQARERGLDDNDLESAVLDMLRIALGDPQPGDPLPPYFDEDAITLDQLRSLDALTQLTDDTQGFWLTLFEIRDLMRLVAVAAELHSRLLDSSSDPVEKTVLQVQIADRLDRIRALVELAAQRRVPPFTPPPAPTSYDAAALAAYFNAALGTVSPVGGTTLGIAAYLLKIEEIQRYFFMTAESFHDVMAQIALQEQQPTLQAPAWNRVDAILEKAHEEKIHEARRQELAAIGYDPNAAGETKDSALARLLEKATGSSSPSDSDLDALLGQTLTRAELRAAVDANNWARVYSILEVVLSNRIGVPPAQKVEWLNLYPAPDATAVGPRRALGGDPVRAERAGSQWATFGLAPMAEQDAPPAPVLGLAISSPLLDLSEGTRIVTLTLGFAPAGVADLAAVLAAQPFVFEVSTAKGWVECQSQPATLGPYETLTGVDLGQVDDVEDTSAEPAGVQFKLAIESNVDPIAPLPAALADIDSPWPLLRLMLRPTWDVEKARPVIRYQELRGLMLFAAHVKVEVTGLKTLALQNDQGALNPKKPFEPFGNSPDVGARLLIGHPEVLTKQLDSLTFNFEWMGAPADLAAHYANYPLPNPVSFTAWIALVDRSVEVNLNTKPPKPGRPPAKIPAPLFGANTAAPTSITATIPASARVIDSKTISKESFEGDLASWKRYLQWELNAPDFQHQAYPAVASEKAINLAADIANGATIVAANYKVKPPYTPKLKSLSLDYSSSVGIQLDAASPGASQVRVFHVHPFGSCDIEAERSATGLPLLPRYDNEGELYIGLAETSPPQTVSILFQMAEGSADPDMERQPIAWSYLDGDRWIPLDDRVLLDTTRGLINTGLVELTLEPAAASARLLGGLYWIRAAIERGSAAVCDTIALHPQAVSATFVDRDNAPDHFKEPLPPQTITQLAAPIAGIAGVRQPYSSFGGRMAEGDGMWATRVSERLRHKQRALSAWDHERLVLDRFPEIYKAKCIPASPERPGEVMIIVIPDIRNLLPSDPFAPKAPSKLLADVEEYLAAKAPAFITVKARNAHYVSVRVRLAVRFIGPGNEGYYIRTLNDELTRFLSPWAYEQGADIAIGGKIYANSIADFVDRRTYVDYVAAVELFRSDDGEHFTPAQDVVEAGRHDAVLAAARTHTIDVIRDAVYDENQMRGIGFMKLELDFIVA